MLFYTICDDFRNFLAAGDGRLESDRRECVINAPAVYLAMKI